MNLAEIELIEIYYRKNYCIGIRFKFDAKIIAACRTLGATWSASNRCWILVNTTRNYYKLRETLEPLGQLNASKLQASYHDRQKGKVLNRDFRLEVEGEASEVAGPYLIQYRQHLRSKSYTDKTVDTYVAIVKAFLNYYRDVDPMDLDVVEYNAYCEQHIVQGGYSLSYHRQLSSCLKKFYEYFKDSKMQTDKIEAPKLRKTLPIVLSREEIRKLILKAPNEKARMIVTLLYSTGMRVGELISLKWDDLQDDEGLIWVRKGKGRKDRQVPLSKKTQEELARYKQRFGQSSYVFEGQYGGPYSSRSVNAYINRMTIRAGIRKKVTAHTLRHSFATHLLDSGIDLRYIQKLLGHTSSKTTEIYTHVSMRRLKDLENPFDTLNL